MFEAALQEHKLRTTAVQALQILKRYDPANCICQIQHLSYAIFLERSFQDNTCSARKIGFGRHIAIYIFFPKYTLKIIVTILLR